MRLSEVFLSHAGAATERLAANSVDQLEAKLRALIDEARAAWPDVELPEDAFLEAVARGIAEEGDPLAALASTRAADLFLASACAAGEPHALAHFDAEFLGPLAARLDRRASATFTDDLRQQVRTRLLIGAPPRPPRIATYRGRAALTTWLSAAIARVAVDLRRAEPPSGSLDDIVRRIACANVDPELAYLKSRYGPELESAVRAALAILSTGDANLLRAHFLDEVNATTLARMYGVSIRTIYRRLDDIRVRVLAGTQRAVRDRLGISAAEFDSLVALAASQIAVSFAGRSDPD